MVQALQDEEQRLVGMARNLSPEAFARYLYKWRRSHMPDNGEAEDEQLRKESFVKRWTRHDGLRGTTIGLDPERDAELHKALDVVMEQLWRSQNPAERDVPPGLRDHHGLRADALMELVRRGMGASVEHGRRSTGGVMALVDLRTLLEGLHPGSVCELDDGTPISPATARRLACEQGVIPVVLGSKGRPLDVGEPVRLATWQQRIALRALYDSCAAEGCDRPFDWCQVHHVDPWARSRNGKLENLVPLCTRHHHQVHQDRWRLTRDPGNGKVTYRRIDATAGAGPPCDQPPDRPPDRPRPPTSSGSEAMGARRAANPATGGRTTAPTLPLDAA